MHLTLLSLFRDQANFQVTVLQDYEALHLALLSLFRDQANFQVTV